MFNSFGNIFRLTSFGESHGKGVGGVIDGFPAGIVIDEEFVQQELNRRRPGQSILTTARKEADKVEFLSGIFEGKSTGCPIGFIVWNENQHSNDYNNLKNVYRPSHADYTYTVKYGIRDHRGGGRSSARETISRVVAGALAKLALRQLGINITAYTSQVGPIKLEGTYSDYNFDLIETNDVRCPDPEKAKEMAGILPEIPKSPSNHFENFLLACMGQEKTRSPFEINGVLSQVFSLGVIAQRLNTRLFFDSRMKQITNNEFANAMLIGTPPRKGWDEFYKL